MNVCRMHDNINYKKELYTSYKILLDPQDCVFSIFSIFFSDPADYFLKVKILFLPLVWRLGLFL